MTEPFTITVPGPLGENLGQNYRGHWNKKAKATKVARLRWAMEAASMSDEPLLLDSVRLTITAYLCRRRPKQDSPDYLTSKTGARPRDPDNLVAMMKPAIDGLKDAGLYLDDTAEHVAIGEPHIWDVVTFGQERVEILVEPLLGGKG